jgi:hypothetical protein
VYLAPHLNAVVKCIYRVSSMVPFTVTVKLSLVNASGATETIRIMHLGSGMKVVRVLDSDSALFATSLQRSEAIVLRSLGTS